jgi:hypothetical protein
MHPAIDLSQHNKLVTIYFCFFDEWHFHKICRLPAAVKLCRSLDYGFIFPTGCDPRVVKKPPKIKPVTTKEPSICCLWCQSQNTIKQGWGKKEGVEVRRYFCKDCLRSFKNPQEPRPNGQKESLPEEPPTPKERIKTACR